MPTSTEISALFANQQQAFAAQTSFAQNIGISAPAFGVGAYRTVSAGGMQGVGPAFPGMRPPPGVYNYAPGGITGPGYGTGNAVASHVMSGLGGTAALAGAGLGVASMFGSFGRVAPLIDPISGFMSGYGGLTARGIMGGLAGASVPIGLGMLAAQGVSSFVHGGQQQQMVSNQLSQFQFFNPNARSGMGFTRDDAKNIGDSIRQIANVPEMMTSMEELTRLLPRMRQMGLMQGVRDAGEFSTRFKDTVKTIRDMARWMGTTMEDAAEFFAHSRSVGFTGRQAQVQNMLNAQFTSGITGMNMGQVMQLQQGGAQTARQFGAKGRFGAQGVLNIAQKLQMGVQSGALDEEVLSDISGGLEGEQAVQASSNRLYQLMLSGSESPAARFILAGALKRGENGKFEVDQEMVKRINAGTASQDELRSRGMSLGRDAKIAFSGPEGRNLRAQLMGNLDWGNFMNTLLASRGEGAPELVLQRYMPGATQPEIEAMMAMGKGSEGLDRENMMRIRGREARLGEQTDPSAIWKRIKTKMHAATFGRVEEAGSDLFHSIGKAYDDFIDDLVGRHVVTLSKESATALSRAFAGGRSRELTELFEAASGFRPGQTTERGLGAKLRESGLMAAIRGMADPNSTGRTAEQQRRTLEAAFGQSGGVASALFSAADNGAFVTRDGRAATADVDRLKMSLARGTGYLEADQGKRLDLLRERAAATMAEGLVTLNPYSGYTKEQIQRDILTNRQALETQLGPVGGLAGAAAKLGDTEAGRLLRAGLSTGGGDLTTGVLRSVQQRDDRLKVSFAQAAGAQGGNFSVADIAQKRRDAEAGLREAKFSGESRAILTSNRGAREIVHSWMQDPNKREAIQEAIFRSRDPVEAVKAIRAIPGLQSATVADVQAAETVMRDASREGFNFGKGGAAVGAIRQALNLGDVSVLTSRVGDAASQVAESAMGVGGRAGSEAEGLASALGTLSKSFTQENFDVAAGKMRELMKSYRGMGKEDQAKLLQALGPAGAAIAAGVNVSRRLRGTVSKSELERLGVTDMSGFAETKGGYKVDEAVRAKVEQAVAGSSLAQSIGLNKGAVETGTQEKLINTLDALKKSSELQTTALYAMMTGDKDKAKEIAATLMGSGRESSGSDRGGNKSLH